MPKVRRICPFHWQIIVQFLRRLRLLLSFFSSWLSRLGLHVPGVEDYSLLTLLFTRAAKSVPQIKFMFSIPTGGTKSARCGFRAQWHIPSSGPKRLHRISSQAWWTPQAFQVTQRLMVLFRLWVFTIYANTNFNYTGLQTEPKARRRFEETFGARIVEVRHSNTLNKFLVAVKPVHNSKDDKTNVRHTYTLVHCIAFYHRNQYCPPQTHFKTHKVLTASF